MAELMKMKRTVQVIPDSELKRMARAKPSRAASIEKILKYREAEKKAKKKDNGS